VRTVSLLLLRVGNGLFNEKLKWLETPQKRSVHLPCECANLTQYETKLKMKVWKLTYSATGPSPEWGWDVQTLNIWYNIQFIWDLWVRYMKEIIANFRFTLSFTALSTTHDTKYRWCRIYLSVFRQYSETLYLVFGELHL